MDARGHRIFDVNIVILLNLKNSILRHLALIWLKIELCSNDIICSACQAESIDTHIDYVSSSSISMSMATLTPSGDLTVGPSTFL